jgi:predicted HTH transcriptional regulator
VSESSFPPLLAQLLERLEAEESLEVEFKTAQGGLPSSIWETVSAFANTSGGWIILGVAESDDGAPVIKGVGDASAQLKAFYDGIRSPQRISYPVCGAGDAAITTVDGKDLIVIRIQAAPRRERPVCTKGNAYTGTYVRRHEGDYLANKQEVDRMMREASDVPADAVVLAKFDLADVDGDALGRYRQIFRTANPVHPWNGYDDRRFLASLGGFRRDRDQDVDGLTVAGLLMFGTEEAIRERRARHLIDYRLLSSDPDASTRWDDRVTWEGNLLGAFETIYPRLTDGLPRPFRLEGGRRVDDSLVHVALREALVNLLVHADYTESQASLITRSPRGFYFRNPGSSRVSEIDLLAGNRSDPRNPSLVRMFRLIGFAEEAGTGIAKIRMAWRELGYRPPDVGNDSGRYEFALNLNYVHLLSDEDCEWLRSIGEGWSEMERIALLVARDEGEVDNLAVRSPTGQHLADVSKVLVSLRDRGYLQMVGAKRGARYQLGSLAAAGALDASAIASSAENLDTSPATIPLNLDKGYPLVVSSSENIDSFPGNIDSLPPRADTSSGVGDQEENNLGELWASLREIARPARQHPHLRAEARDGIIIHLCTQTPLSVQEIAQLLDRSEVLVRGALRALIEANRLSYLYPNQPSRPGQRYTIPTRETPHD